MIFATSKECSSAGLNRRRRRRGPSSRRPCAGAASPSVAVLLVSITMAIFAMPRDPGTVSSLADAAERVRSSRTSRSVRCASATTLFSGILTETFNEMLAGIQSRDAELAQHRSHLEALVAARTEELATRNRAMRLVLDNVDQGLATIGVDGKLGGALGLSESLFERATARRPFCEVLAAGDERLRLLLKLGWEQVVEGFLPAEVSLEQLPKGFDQGDRHFTLAIKPILEKDAVVGGLLVVSDVTSELEAQKEQARQREEVQIFSASPATSQAFSRSSRRPGASSSAWSEHDLDPAEQLALVHIRKGNASQRQRARSPTSPTSSSRSSWRAAPAPDERSCFRSFAPGTRSACRVGAHREHRLEGRDLAGRARSSRDEHVESGLSRATSRPASRSRDGRWPPWFAAIRN